jgi:1,4-dihydroxy-6-naphthoate synthase
MTSTSRPLLHLGHSPDPDDAFMWWPLFEPEGRPARIDTGRFRYEPVTDDIESLNRRAGTGELEITAMSCARYPSLRDRYAITACGASLGDGYGPRLVAPRAMDQAALCAPDVVIAVPGTWTSAFAALSLWLGPGRFRHETVPFDEIIDRVVDGSFAAGVVIHEGQLTFGDQGLEGIVDLGAWWTGQEGLPLPLGINTIRRDLEAEHGPGTLREVTGMLLESVRYALAHREEAIDHALAFARGMGDELADRFVEMYVNRWTLDFEATGRQAVRRFLDRLHAAGLAPDPGEIDLVDAADVDPTNDPVSACS